MLDVGQRARVSEGKGLVLTTKSGQQRDREAQLRARAEYLAHHDHSWHGVNDESDWAKGYWVHPATFIALLFEDEQQLHPTHQRPVATVKGGMCL